MELAEDLLLFDIFINFKIVTTMKIQRMQIFDKSGKRRPEPEKCC